MSTSSLDPFIFSSFGIERSFLQRSQSKRESWSEFPKFDFVSIFELVPMMPEEDVVPLIMKSYGTFSVKLGIVMKQSSQHSSQRMAKSGGEIVQDDFGSVIRDILPIFPNVFGDFDIAQLEMGSGAIGQVGDDETIGTSIVLVDNQDVCKTLQL